MKGKLGAVVAFALFASTANADVLINEVHYDNAGTDEGEFIEVVATNSETPADIDVYLYNGSDMQLYSDVGTPGTDIFNVGTDFSSDGNIAGVDYYTIMLPVNGLQNGSPDGIAITLFGSLIEFISYEGTFTGVGSVADGFMSTDIGVEETSSTLIGSSVQRIDFGSTWVVTDGSNTKGGLNVPEPATLSLLAIGGIVLIRRRR